MSTWSTWGQPRKWASSLRPPAHQWNARGSPLCQAFHVVAPELANEDSGLTGLKWVQQTLGLLLAVAALEGHLGHLSTSPGPWPGSLGQSTPKALWTSRTRSWICERAELQPSLAHNKQKETQLLKSKLWKSKWQFWERFLLSPPWPESLKKRPIS